MKKVGQKNLNIKKIFPHVFVALGFCLLFSMGVWQAKRLVWKTSLIEKIDTRLNQAPIKLSDYKNKDEDEFKIMELEGEFLVDKDQVLVNRQLNGKAGSNVLSPFKDISGDIIIVNRGWFAADEKYEKSPAQQKITGIIRTPHPANWLSLKNEPGKGFWYWVELDKIEDSVGATHKDFYLEQVSDAPLKTYPYPLPKKIELYNEHLTYAITWFSLSIALLITYYFRFWYKKPNKKSGKKK